MTIMGQSFPRRTRADFAGRRVLLVGCASGIGLAAVRALVDAGASVALVDRQAEQLAKLAADTGCPTSRRTWRI